MDTPTEENFEIEPFRELLGRAQLGILQIDADGVMLWANPVFYNQLGYKPEELIGHSNYDFIHPDDDRPSRERIRKLANSTTPIPPAERRYRHRDGHHVWFNITATSIRNKKGEFLYVMGVFQDVTERKRQDALLKESEARLDAVLNGLQDVVWSFSAQEQKLLYINDNAAQALYGRSADEFYANPKLWMEVVLPEDRHILTEIQADLRKAGSPDHLYRIVRKNGEIRWVHSRAWVTVGTEGSPLRYEGAVRDVHELKLAENARRENEERLQMVMEVGRIGIWELCLSTQTAVWSKVLREICDLPPEVPPSPETFFKIIHPEDRERITGNYGDLISKGKQSHPEFRIVLKDGSIRWVQTIGKILTIGEGKTQTLIGALADVTESRELQLTIETQRGKMMAASKMSALGEMASGLAHEINNPLAIIHGNSIVLKELAQKEKTFDTGKISAIADTIQQTSNRISKITKSLRWFARDAEMDPFEEMAISALVEETAEFCRERFITHGISFCIEPIAPDLVLECQPVQISQVILNLLNNAHDAVEHAPEKWIKVSVRDLGARAEIMVADSGHGVPTALKEKIFQPFFTTKEIGKGTGLGLSVARGIIESHLGSLSLDQESINTCFVISIPKKQPKSQRPRRRNATLEPTL